MVRCTAAAAAAAAAGGANENVELRALLACVRRALCEGEEGERAYTVLYVHSDDAFVFTEIQNRRRTQVTAH